MKIGDVVKKLPSKDKIILTYEHKFIITYSLSADIYSLYEIVDDGYRFLKTRKNNPLFSECGY